MTTGTAYTFELEIEPSDLRVFGRYIARRNASSYVGAAAVLGVALGAVVGIQSGYLENALVATVSVLITSTFGFWYMARTSPRRAARRSPGGPFRLTVGTDGLVTVSATTTIHRQWRAISDVVERQGLLMLFVTATIALMIPRRVVATDAEWTALVADVTTWWGLGIGRS